MSRITRFNFMGEAVSRFALLLALEMAGGAARAAEPMRFWNLTGETVDELRLAPAGSDRFGPNQCANDKDGTVDNDERLRLTGIGAGRYDVMLRWTSGRACTVHGVQLRGEGKYAFSLEPKDLSECR